MSLLNTYSWIWEIKISSEYWEVSKVIYPYDLQISNILDSEKWNRPSGYFVDVWSNGLDKKLDEIEFESIRRLKQALNNYFCTEVYQIFKSQLDLFAPWNLVNISDDNKLKPLDINSFLYNKGHPLLLTVMVEFITTFNRLKISIWKLIPKKYRINLICYYLNVWDVVLRNTFLQLLQGVIYKDEQTKKIFWEYLILESYVLRKTPIDEEKWFCSIIDAVLLNYSITYLKKYISEELKWTIDIEKIRNFLSKHAEYKKKISSSLKATDISNFFEISWWNSDGLVFSSREWCYVVNKERGQQSSTYLTEKAWVIKLQWCPFSQTQINTWENAFLNMFHTLDWFLITILSDLKMRWL